MKVLQLGKFYPIRGGVEKVMEMLTEGLSARGVRGAWLSARQVPERLAISSRTRRKDRSFFMAVFLPNMK